MATQETQTFHWRYTEFNDHNFQIRGRNLFSVVVLFSAILLITLLILYSRWVFRLRHPRAATENPHAPPPPEPLLGLDLATINSFPVVMHQSSTTISVGESDCCICLGVFEEGDKLKVLPNCSHCYHSECVDRWLRAQPSCPLCRSSLRADSPV